MGAVLYSVIKKECYQGRECKPMRHSSPLFVLPGMKRNKIMIRHQREVLILFLDSFN